MDEVREERIIQLIRSCSGMTADERERYLADAFRDDPELRGELDRLVGDAGSRGAGADLPLERLQSALPRHYHLIRSIGRGGMGEVFLARDERLNRSVAIKFMSAEFARDPDRVRRFVQEARAASALNHPNILTIHDIGESGGVHYIVSEFVDGETLRSRIARSPLPIETAADIAKQIATALSASHRAGIIHRDLKPDNVMVRSDGTVKVLDFGLAKETWTAGEAAGRSMLEAETLAQVVTMPGLVLGTPRYMSPEQARGLELDARTDIFSLGVMIYEMVCGRAPFAAQNTADSIVSLLEKDPPDLCESSPDAPPTLRHIVEKALRKDRGERYQSIDHLLSDIADLQRELAGEGHVSRAGTAHLPARLTEEASVSRQRRSRVAVSIAAASLVALVAAAGWYAWSSWPAPGTVPRGAMRSIAITSWNSNAGEWISAASFSPDGRMIAFAAARSARSEIWIKPVGGGEAVQVTKNGFENQYPIWSPDGQNIAFLSNRGDSRALWRVSFTGGEQVQMISGVGPATRLIRWGPSGKIYFQDGAELYSVDAGSGARSQLTDLASKGMRPRVIEVSPDETAIAVTVRDGEMWKVKRLVLASGAIDELAASKDQIDYLAWTPDNQSVVYSGAVDGAYQIFEARIGQAEPVKLSNGNTDFLVQDVSADGRQILYGSVTETSDLWSVDTADGRTKPVANDVPAEYWPDVSPDGRGVAFQSVRQAERAFGGAINVVSRDAGGGAGTMIAPQGFSPVWSNDGKWIAFFKRTDNGVGILRVSPTGEDLVKLAGDAVTGPGYTSAPYLKIGINHISWSPDSSSLAFAGSTSDGASNIWIVPADGGDARALTHNEDRSESYFFPTWSPDGRSVAFVSESPRSPRQSERKFRLWIVDANGGGPARVIFESPQRFRFLGFERAGGSVLFAQNSDPRDMSPTPAKSVIYRLAIATGERSVVTELQQAYFHNIHLSRDAGSIAFVTRREDVTALWAVQVAAGGKAAARRLFVENDPKVLISSLAWSPDSRSIVFGKQTRTNLLSMLTN
ncbi:MAG: protein kinase domain-containing protein [Pyrinomonadaceae bacterium]